MLVFFLDVFIYSYSKKAPVNNFYRDAQAGLAIKLVGRCLVLRNARVAVVHLNYRAGSTFPVPVCTVPSSMDRTSRCNKVDAVRLYASYRLNLLLLKGQICVTGQGYSLTIPGCFDWLALQSTYILFFEINK